MHAKRMAGVLFTALAVVWILAPRALAATYGEDLAFLKRHTEILVLSDQEGAAQVALAPAWQGRVMTSTAHGFGGRSFGWINHEHIASRKIVPHMNIFGG